MPAPSLVNLAIFSTGAAIGALTVSFASRKEKRVERPPLVTSAHPGTNVATGPSPVVDLMPTGKPGFMKLDNPPPGEVLKYGNPGPIADFLQRRAYVTAYDRRLRHPAWTAEHLTAANIRKQAIDKNSTAMGEKGDRSKSVFKEDEAIIEPFRAKLADYFRSGYDRGHMVPAADAKVSQEAMDETFLLSNIAPQVGVGFNRHYWAYVEEWCRKLTDKFSDVYVFTIPLYIPKLHPDGKSRVTYEVIGNPPNVAVPTHFAKVVLTTRPTSPSTPLTQEISTGAFVLPNDAISDETPFSSFIVPIESVERAAGLVLFSDAVKKSSKHICQTTDCSVIVRRFDDAQQQAGGKKLIGSPKK